MRCCSAISSAPSGVPPLGAFRPLATVTTSFAIPVALGIEDREHRAVPGCDVDPGAVLGGQQRARPGHAGKRRDRETGWQLELVERAGRRTRPHHPDAQQQDQEQTGAARGRRHGAPRIVADQGLLAQDAGGRKVCAPPGARPASAAGIVLTPPHPQPAGARAGRGLLSGERQRRPRNEVVAVVAFATCRLIALERGDGLGKTLLAGCLPGRPRTPLGGCCARRASPPQRWLRRARRPGGGLCRRRWGDLPRRRC